MSFGEHFFTYIWITLICFSTDMMTSATNYQKHGGGHHGQNKSAHLNDVISDWELDLPVVSTSDEYIDVPSGMSGHPGHLGEDSSSSLATHSDVELILAELGAVSQQITSLRTQVGNLKYQNHVMYKQLKKVNNRCQYASTGVEAAPKRLCPRGYTHNAHLNSCYKFVVDRVSWRMARERCMADGSDLISIESSKEQRFITETAHNDQVLRHCDFWTGGTDKGSEGQWRWIGNDEPVLYSNWNINEPNNGNYDEHCLHMLWVFNWAWNDARCSVDNACFICEINKDAQEANRGSISGGDGGGGGGGGKGRSGRGAGRRGNKNA